MRKLILVTALLLNTSAPTFADSIGRMSCAQLQNEYRAADKAYVETYEAGNRARTSSETLAAADKMQFLQARLEAISSRLRAKQCATPRATVNTSELDHKLACESAIDSGDEAGFAENCRSPVIN